MSDCVLNSPFSTPMPSSGINNYIEVLQRQCSGKTAVKELGKMEYDKTVLKKVPPVLYL